MHKIAEKEFTLEDFSTEHLLDYGCDYEYFSKTILKNTIETLNKAREDYLNRLKSENKFGLPANTYWWQMIQLLPSSYNQTRNVMLNYEVLANIYRQRKHHKLDEWRELCKWIETLPYSELITGTEEMKVYADNEEITNEQK